MTSARTIRRRAEKAVSDAQRWFDKTRSRKAYAALCAARTEALRVGRRAR